MRAWPLVALLAGNTLSGCIIYQDHYFTDKDCKDDCDDDDRSDDQTTPAVDPAPQETRDFALTENEGLPGATLLTFLIPATQTADVGRVVSVEFERDVVVLDAENRGFEMVMVVAIDPDAEAGDSEVILRTDDNALHLLAEPFRILDVSDTGADTGTTGTGTGTTGTGTTGTGTTGTGTTGTGTGTTGTGTGTTGTGTTGTGTTGTGTTGTGTTGTGTTGTGTTTTGTTTTGDSADTGT